TSTPEPTGVPILLAQTNPPAQLRPENRTPAAAPSLTCGFGTPTPANLVRASPLFPRGKHAEFGIVVEFDDAAALRRQVVRRLTDKLAAIPSNCVIPEFEQLRS
ncbi:MAG: hypothetical protein ABSF71_33385, partial [Terriglobia bacterium]